MVTDEAVRFATSPSERVPWVRPAELTDMMRLALLVVSLAIGCGASNDGLADFSGVAGSSDLAASDAFSTTTPDLLHADRGSTTAVTHDYGSDGPESIEHFTVTATNGSTSIPLTIYAPQAGGARAAVLLASGLQQPAVTYVPYAERLASWGIVTLLRDDPGILSSSTSVASDVTYVVGSWLPAQNGDASSMLYGRIDVARVGLAGHSRGGQATLLALEGDLHGKVSAWFGIDPVDSLPMGTSGPQARTQLGTIAVPTVFLGETTDGSGASACAPTADNYQVLYGDAPSPSVRIDALGADDTQLEAAGSCNSCQLCTAGSATASVVLDYSVRYVTAFFARELDGDAQVGATFDGAGAAADIAAARVNITSK